MKIFQIGAFVCAACLVAGTAFGGPSIPSQFGNRVSENPRFKAPFATLDLDGDGAADQVYLVSIAPGSPKATFAADVTVLPDVFEPTPTALGNRDEKIALAVVFGKTGRKFLITDCDESAVHFFDTDPNSIWSANPIPITAARRGSAQFRDFQKQEKRIRNDVLVLGTEAGTDIALYWNGKTFTVFWPADGD